MSEQNGTQIATIESGVNKLIALAIDKDLDIDKLERLLVMKRDEEDRTAYTAFVVAISNFQAKCPTVEKTGTVKDKHGIQLYTYPKFNVIWETVKPHLDENGLSVRFSSDISDGQVKIHCMVSHVGGHTDDSYFSCPIEASMTGGANAAQRTASANSFAKRYAIMNALNIAGDDFDDDGQSLDADIETITPEQAASMRDDISKMKADEAYFCSWLKIPTLEDMPVNLLVKAQNAIKAENRDH